MKNRQSETRNLASTAQPTADFDLAERERSIKNPTASFPKRGCGIFIFMV